MKKALIGGIVLALAACSTSGPEADVLLDEAGEAFPIELSSGTSFGMCAGYCNTELTIDSLELSLTETDSRGDQTPRTRTLPLSVSDRERIRGLVDAAALKRLEGVHGCPDCADGGAEWIQVVTPAGPVRVTFEYGATLAGIAPLQAEIRALRARFPR